MLCPDAHCQTEANQANVGERGPQWPLELAHFAMTTINPP